MTRHAAPRPTSRPAALGERPDVLVCLGVWLCFAAHDVPGKVLAIVFPISAVLAPGFEQHPVANMYLIPIGWLAGSETVTLATCLANLVPVTLGNIVGGGVFGVAVYWLVRLHQGERLRFGIGRAGTERRRH